MKTYAYFSAICLLAGTACLCDAHEPQAAHLAAKIAPFLDQQAILVAHADYAGLDPDATVAAIGKLLGKRAEMAESSIRQKTFAIQALTEAGAKEAYFVMSVADVPKSPGMLVVPVPGTADSKAIGAALEKIQGGPHFLVEQIGNAMVSAGPDTLARLKKDQPVRSPHLPAAFAAVEDAAMKIALTPPDYFRSVIEQTLPELPEVVGGGPSTILTAGVQWAAVGVDFEPQPNVRVVVQSESPEAAAALAKKLGEACELLRKNEKARSDVPNIDEIMPLLALNVENDRVVLTLSVENGRLPLLMNALLPK